MLIYHKGHTDTIQVYSVTVMIHVKALQAGHSSQATSEPITLVSLKSATLNFYQMCVSDGSCLCEACMFMKHINCVNLFMKHIVCVSLQYVYMQLPVVYSI